MRYRIFKIGTMMSAVMLMTVAGCGGNVESNVAIEDFPIRELPSDASYIHFALNPGIRNPNSYFEFTTSETEFLSWIIGELYVSPT